MSMKVTINWDEVESYELIDPGVYEAVIETKGHPPTTTQSGDPAFMVRFWVIHDGRKSKVDKKYSLAGKGLPFTKELAEAALGVKLVGKSVFDPAMLHGKKVRVVIEHFTTTAGRTINTVGRVLPLNDSDSTTDPGEDGGSAEELLKKLLEQ